MISDQQRFELKTRFGNIYSTTINKVDYIFRPLTLQEYRYILSTIGESGTDTDIEDHTVRLAVVDPPNVNIDKMKAGHVTALADEILRISGFTDLDYLVEVLSKTRDEFEEASYMMKAFIIATMPSYTDEDLDGFTVEQLLKKVVMAEKILSVQQAANGIPQEMAVLFALGPETEQQEPTPQEQKRAPMDKEQLLSRLTATDGQVSGKRVDKEALKKFDEEELLRLTGIPQSRDPIAEKLRQSLM